MTKPSLPPLSPSHMPSCATNQNGDKVMVHMNHFWRDEFKYGSVHQPDSPCCDSNSCVSTTRAVYKAQRYRIIRTDTVQYHCKPTLKQELYLIFTNRYIIHAKETLISPCSATKGTFCECSRESFPFVLGRKGKNQQLSIHHFRERQMF